MIRNKEEAGNLRLLDMSYRKDVNLIKIGANNSWAHEMAKCIICIYLKKNKRNFVTEAIFKEGKGRVDVLDITRGICYEVVTTEKKESIEVKKGKYPLDLIELNSIDVMAYDPNELWRLLE